MRNICLSLFATLILSACASVQTPLDDGYQYGDLGEWREDYCTEADLKRRAVLLALAARSGLSLPANGVCADPLEVLDASPIPD